MNMPILNMKSNSMPQQQRGVAAVEFALVIIPLLLIVAGIIEFGRTFWYYDALAKSTRDAARYVSNTRVSSTVGVDDTVKENAKLMVMNAVNTAKVPNFTMDNVNVVCDPVDCIAPNYVTVSIIDYSISIGSWIPIIFYTGTSAWVARPTPATTMRYMQ
jgi:Flp pilus assembly protein TadG